MQHFFAIVGRNTELAATELRTVLKNSGVTLKLTHAEGRVAIGQVTCGLIDYTNLQRQLGGAVKLGEIIETLPIDGSRDETITRWLTADKLSELLPQTDKRKNVGLSFYNVLGNTKPHRLNQKIIKHALHLKSELKSRKIPLRLVTSKQSDLSSVIITQEKILERGVEIAFFLDNDKIYVGLTKTVQDFKNYSFRDYQRPARDSLSGMLPPKLAQMMINIAGAPKNGVLLDPFCGSGTVLQEAVLLGYKKLKGSDLSDKAVSDSRTNIAWLMKKYGVDADVDLFIADVADLEKEIAAASIDAIVTEPYLGPPEKGRVNATAVQKTRQRLEHLYGDGFAVLARLLKPGGSFVAVIPSFHVRGKEYALDLKKIIPENITQKHFLHYARPGQYVERHIFVGTREGGTKPDHKALMCGRKIT